MTSLHIERKRQTNTGVDSESSSLGVHEAIPAGGQDISKIEHQRSYRVAEGAQLG